MGSLKNLAIPSVLALLFIFTFSYAMKNNWKDIPFVSTLFDTQDITDEPEIFGSKDLGAMFNERGYMKSNSVSFDEKEIINDFNGNLMYSIPIAQGKDKGDITYEFSLNYNGNVNHQFITAEPEATYWNFGKLYKYNMTAPGWILSVNGLAVQMMNNFETNFFTRSSDPDGNGVKLLAPGYHYTNTMDAGCLYSDKITIMLGDGSTETLYNTADCEYTGIYESKSKNSFIKAHVEFIPEEVGNPPTLEWPDGSEEPGWPRRMRLMKGDGLTYVYKETFLEYKDHKKETGMASWFWPKAFMLDSITDRFGHGMKLEYDPQGTSRIGRPWVTKVPGAEIKYANIWGTVIGIAIFTIDGKYLFYTEPFGTSVEQEHRPDLQKIVNPSGETMLFDYEIYSRSGTNIYKDNSSTFSISLSGGYDGLSRLEKVINYDGGIREYTYFDEGGANTMNYIPATNESWIHSSSGNYKGEGRDLFFCNSLKDVTVKKGATSIRKETFNYTYNISRSFDDVWDHPIDTNDAYVTTRTTTSLDNTYNYNTPTSSKSVKVYKNYAIDVESNSINLDYSGTMQLITNEAYSGTETLPFKTITNLYDVGDASNSQTKFDGTFLTTEVREGRYNNSIKRAWTYNYTGGGDEPISVKEETDPLGITTKTTYHSPFYEENYEVFLDATYQTQGGQGYSYVYFYLLNQPTEILVKKNSTVLSKKIFSYYDPSSVTGSQVQGYPGQLQYERIVDPNNSNNYQQTSYVYYNQDTTGEHIHVVNSFKSTLEGNLKEIIDPKGYKKKYYYEVISWKEDYEYAANGCDYNTDEYQCPPRISYHVMNDDGTHDLIRKNWTAAAMDLPSRIDQYYDATRFITNYQLYNGNGNPTQMVNPNNYYSLIEYEKYYRIGTATLPYDFNELENDTVENIIQTNRIVEVNTPLIQFGYRNELNGEQYYLTDKVVNAGNFYDWTRIDLSGPDGPLDRKYRALMQFDNSNYEHISEIDSAFIEFAPYYITATHNSTPTNDYALKLRPIIDIDMLTFNQSTDIQSFGNIGVSSSTNCGLNPVEVYTDNHRKYDITTLLNDQITFQSNVYKLNMEGLQFELHYTGSGTDVAEMHMKFYPCSTDTNIWNNIARPRLKIYAKTTRFDTIRTPIFKRGTLIYSYRDDTITTPNDKVTVKAKLDGYGTGNRMKTTQFLFNEFSQLSESKIYTTSSTGNTSYTYYNYLDGVGKTTDAIGNQTKLSYNRYGNNSETENADNSENFSIDTVLSALQTTYYNYTSSFINRKTYTDETGRIFHKYFDPVGNLIRETKYVAGDGGGDPEITDNPYNPDTTFGGQDMPTQVIPLFTDYKYDSLYRVTRVTTPNQKEIVYTYDVFGRQTKRVTPDAGITKYWYDLNNNLTYSQDSVQRSFSPQKYTERTYDGLNRLLTISEFASNPEDPEDAPSSSNLFVVNCYDTLASSFTPFYSILDNEPLGYYGSTSNNTKGLLVATAYRTRLSDDWSYKFYRYDARGRVTRFWHYLPGLGWKFENYAYNSQNQIIRNSYQPGSGDGNTFTYTYDDAARLSTSNLYVGSTPDSPGGEGDNPSDFINLSEYIYNANSQVSEHSMNRNTYSNNYAYNNRTWISSMNVGGSPKFKYVLLYHPNGNINIQTLEGSYLDNFTDDNERMVKYTYDNSNRLMLALYQKLNNADTVAKVINNFDKDGNFTVLKRFDAGKTPYEDFGYEYYSGTNMLRKINPNSNKAQYTYDGNGNMFKDEINKNYNMLFDHRNLMTDIRTIRLGSGDPPPEITYWTVYKYDEAGNRVRKSVYQYNGEDPDPTYEDNEDNPSWSVVSNEYYVRDINGKEIAIYSNTTLTQWNLWALDQIGHMNSDTTKYYYLKDHLGSTRAVINNINTVISAQDYDAWGHLQPDRLYSNSSMKYDYTGKERDNESNFDYFGARYYDSKIGRWGVLEPLLPLNIGVSPYAYVVNNPIALKDKFGLDDHYYLEGSNQPIIFRTSFSHRYFYEHSSGNWEVTEATGDYTFMYGKTFYQAFSPITASFYSTSKKGEPYSSEDIMTNFTDIGQGLVISGIERADISEKLVYKRYLKIGLASIDFGPFDYKQILSKSMLYLFGNKLFNQQEAGNILWGMTMAFYDIPLWQIQVGADFFKIGKSLYNELKFELDEENEKMSFIKGYRFFKNNIFYQ